MISSSCYFEYLDTKFHLEYVNNGSIHRISVGVIRYLNQYGYTSIDTASCNGSTTFDCEMAAAEAAATEAMIKVGNDIDEIDLYLPLVRSKFKKMLNSSYGANSNVIKVTI